MLVTLCQDSRPAAERSLVVIVTPERAERGETNADADVLRRARTPNTDDLHKALTPTSASM